jgi:hypothetical protein
VGGLRCAAVQSLPGGDYGGVTRFTPINDQSQATKRRFMRVVITLPVISTPSPYNHGTRLGFPSTSMA